MPTSNENEMGKVKMYAVVDGEYREVIELQGEITLSECDEQLWQYDYVRVVRCRDCRHWRDDNPRANGYHCCYRMHNIFPMKESDFCSRGERRTNETD